MDGTLCSSSFTNNASVACKDINLDSASDVLALAMCSSLKNAKKKVFFRWFHVFNRTIQCICNHSLRKVEMILKDSLDSIPSTSPSVKIQIMGGKVCLRCKGKTLLGIVNKLLKIKRLLTMSSNNLPSELKHTFPPIFWIFTEGEVDGIECSLSS